MSQDVIDASMRAALMSEYRKITAERVARIRAIVHDETRTSEILRELHTLRGEALMMGFREIGASARQLETIVQHGARGREQEILTRTDAIASLIHSMTAPRSADDPRE